MFSGQKHDNLIILAALTEEWIIVMKDFNASEEFIKNRQIFNSKVVPIS